MNLQELLAELQRTYLASMPDKIANIESLWKSGERGLLETEYHKLKGTGRTYGLPEITQVGEAMERLCEGSRETLDRAVPLSLGLLQRIYEVRTRGEPMKVENDPDFRVVIELVQNEFSG